MEEDFEEEVLAEGTVPSSELTQKREKLQVECSEFIENGWSFTSSFFLIKLNQSDSSLQLKKIPQPVVLKSLRNKTDKEIFHSIFSLEFWNLLKVYLIVFSIHFI